MSSSSRHAVVIGGGVIGTACAYYLMRAGWQVTLIDRGGLGSGSSHGNCGFVCPSHVLPLAEPGMVAQGDQEPLPAQLAVRDQAAARPGALVVALPLRPALQRARHDRGRPRHPAAARSSLRLYRELIEREGLDCEFETRAAVCLPVERGDGGLRATDRLMTESFDCPAQRYDGDAVLELEPALKPGLAGGWYYHDDAHLRPDKLMRPGARSSKPAA